MKKIIIVLFILTITMVSLKEEHVVIPEDAIRFRIIASSNKIEDQQTKIEIKEELKPLISDILQNSDNEKSTKENINNNLNNFKKVINKYTSDYSINYGMNYFPEKEYKHTRYKAGEYESLVITLGSGEGENWWCVLFPPLCLLEASENTLDDNTYSFYIKDLIDKYKN